MASKIGNVVTCPECGHPLKHLHNEAHGVPGTHMAGSERYECQIGHALYKEEGSRHGLTFILD